MYPRVSASFPVEYTVSNQTFREKASTLGGGGLFLRVEQLLAPGTPITLRFRPAKHLPLIEAKAKVCYQISGQGFAVEFTDISPEHRMLLLRLIHHRKGNKRSFPRAPLATQIESQQMMSLALSRDVSPGGIFVETTQPLSVGVRMKLRFNLGDGGPVVEATAEVTYSVKDLGMGVQFIDISAADRKRILGYVSEALGLPRPPAETQADR